jgi:hypothetical protein
MDIGEQQRVIIVEVEERMQTEPAPVVREASRAEAPERAVARPLPLELDPESIGQVR